MASAASRPGLWTSLLLRATTPVPVEHGDVQAAERSRDLLDRHVADQHVHLDDPELVGLLLLVVVAPGLPDSGVGGGEPEGDGLPEHLPVEGLQ